MEFHDKVLKCVDCGKDFIFTAGEQLFFHDKQFHNDPKRCKACKLKRGGSSTVRAETRTHCSVCGEETTVPFRPTQGRPVLCRSCFEQNRRTPSTQPPAAIAVGTSAVIPSIVPGEAPTVIPGASPSVLPAATVPVAAGVPGAIAEAAAAEIGTSIAAVASEGEA